MHLPTLTDDELLRYAGTLALTPLETELVRRFTEYQDEAGDNEQRVMELESELDDLKALA